MFKPVPQTAPAARNIPSRFNLTYAFELVSLDKGTGAASNRVVNLPMQPARYEVGETYGSAISPTVLGVSVEESGFTLRECLVAGHCGLAPKRGWSAGTPMGGGDLILADGNTLWRELRSLFRLHAWLREHSGEAGTPRYFMAWHDFVNDDHWVVVPTAFRGARSADTHRLHYPYEISFTAVGDYDRAKKNFFDDGIFGEIKGVAAKVRNLIAKIAGYIEDARAFVAGADAFISGVLLGTINAVSTLLTAASDLKNAVRDFINLPKRIAAAIRDLVDQWHALLEDREATAPWTPASQAASERLAGLEVAAQMADAIDGLLASDVWQRGWAATAAEQAALQAGEAGLTSRDLANAAARGTAGGPSVASTLALTARGTPGSAIRAAAPPRSQERQRPAYAGQRDYVVRAGDTLASIAVREVGDPDAWMDIRDANRLAYPYVTTLGLPGTVGPGDHISIPVSTATTTPVGSRGIDGDEPSEDQILGVDCLLTPEGEWEVDPSGTDVARVRGIACYEQDLGIKFATDIGTNLLYPHVGILAPIGSQNGQGMPQAVALSVRTAVVQDPRTAGLGPLNVKDTGDGIAVEIVAYPLGSRDGRVLRKAV